jgi:CrcB protein
VEVRFPIAWPDEGPDRRELAAVYLGGCVGAVLRAEIATHLAHGAGSWPWATFLVNVAGAFVLGLLIALEGAGRLGSPHLRPLLGAGFCGALTTFSTFQLELFKLLDGGHIGLAVGYAAASLAAGYAAVRLARALVRG